MKTIENLVEYLKKCDDAYYNSDTTLVSNDTYDALVQTLKNLDPNNPYLNKVGAELRVGSSKVGRLVPMGTLAKYHTDDEVLEWLSSESGEMILLAPKYDGFGIELTYINGKLSMASTRGDGYTGEDVTEAMKFVNSVPKEIPHTSLTTVRGEAIIPRVNHGIIKSMGYIAMRNAVPGIVRSFNKEALKYVDFIAYEFFDNNTKRGVQRNLYRDTFNVEDWQCYRADEFEEILKTRNDFGSTKDMYTYEVDGMVLKTDGIKSNDDLSCPKHSVAWKFRSNRRETVLRSIDFQLGATGKFTPIAIFDPVEFQGAQLTRASLGSMDRFYEMRPAVGDTIEVSRRGDIIPYCEDIIERIGEFQSLDHCPHCGSKLVDNMCVNKECPEIVFLQIRNFVGTLGVKGIGPSLVKGLIDSGAIHKLSDVYKVKDSDILSLPRQGQSAVDKWNTLINKELEAKVFLSAMPFDNIGIKAWESLLDKWSYKDLMNVTEDDLRSASIRGLGEGKIKEFIRQLNIYRGEILTMYGCAKIR